MIPMGKDLAADIVQEEWSDMLGYGYFCYVIERVRQWRQEEFVSDGDV